jgi:hypothetical protein
MVQAKVYFRLPDGMEILLPEDLKPVALGQSIEESGRGTTGLAGAYNLHAMKYRDNLAVDFPIGKFPYDGGDGLFDYCAARTLREEIIIWWAFLHRYTGIDDHLKDGRDFLNFFGPAYCPPGYTSAWISAHGGRNYTDLIYDVHRLEAIQELRKYGWGGAADVPIVVPPPADYSVVNGMLIGPDVHRRLVKNHDRFPRPKTDGIVLHASGSLMGTSKVIVDGIASPGILDAWDNLAEQRSANLIIGRDAMPWQAVDLTLPAWATYGHNSHTIGIELENIGSFYPWQEILGWFYRFRGKPWEQRVRKAEMFLVNGLYYQDYPEAQIARLLQILPALKAAWPTILTVKGHFEMSGNAAWDPGPLFPWDRVRAALA